MKIEVLNCYKRRGNKCYFTFKISGVRVIQAPDNDPHAEFAYAWGYFRWTGDLWLPATTRSKPSSINFHELYMPDPRPTEAELIEALTESIAAKRAIDTMKKEREV